MRYLRASVRKEEQHLLKNNFRNFQSFLACELCVKSIPPPIWIGSAISTINIEVENKMSIERFFGLVFVNHLCDSHIIVEGGTGHRINPQASQVFPANRYLANFIFMASR
jgi:hypothetical protein